MHTYPRNVEICLGYSLYEAAQLPEAVTMIERALARSEDDIPTDELYADYGIAGAIYNQTGNISKAIRCTEKCVAILRTLEDKTDLYQKFLLILIKLLLYENSFVAMLFIGYDVLQEQSTGNL